MVDVAPARLTRLTMISSAHLCPKPSSSHYPEHGFPRFVGCLIKIATAASCMMWRAANLFKSRASMVIRGVPSGRTVSPASSSSSSESAGSSSLMTKLRLPSSPPQSSGNSNLLRTPMSMETKIISSRLTVVHDLGCEFGSCYTRGALSRISFMA